MVENWVFGFAIALKIHMYMVFGHIGGPKTKSKVAVLFRTTDHFTIHHDTDEVEGLLKMFFPFSNNLKLRLCKVYLVRHCTPGILTAF